MKGRGFFRQGKSAGMVPLIGIMVLLIGLAIILAILPIFRSIAERDKVLAYTEEGSISYLEGIGYTLLTDGDCYPYDFIPCEDNTQTLGTENNRWEKAWLGSGSLHVGSLEISNTAQQMDIDGQLVMHGEGKVWMETQPDLDFSSMIAQGVPSQAIRGVSSGFSLPIWNNNSEELYVGTDVPREWDGITNPVVHLHCYVVNGNNLNKRFKLNIYWAAYSPRDNEKVPAVTTTMSQEITCSSVDWYITYLPEFEIDYDINGAGNEAKICDQLDLKIRRVAASQDEIAGEVVITHIGIRWLRDKLGEVMP